MQSRSPQLSPKLLNRQVANLGCRSPAVPFADGLAPDLAFSSPVSPDAQGLAGSAVPRGSFCWGALLCFLSISPFKSQQQLLLCSWQTPCLSGRCQY